MDYSTEKKRTGVNRFNIRLPVLVLLCFAVFILTVAVSWQDGAIYLKSALLQQEDMLPVAALNCFAEELRCGSSVITSFVHFCREAVS